MINLVTLSCRCCGDKLLCPWNIVQVGQIIEKVAIVVNIPFKECPTCGYNLDGIRFNAPEIGVKHKPGMKGLK